MFIEYLILVANRFIRPREKKRHEGNEYFKDAYIYLSIGNRIR